MPDEVAVSNDVACAAEEEAGRDDERRPCRIHEKQHRHEEDLGGDRVSRADVELDARHEAEGEDQCERETERRCGHAPVSDRQRDRDEEEDEREAGLDERLATCGGSPPAFSPIGHQTFRRAREVRLAVPA